MFARLTKAKRLRAGRLVTLAYMLCVLAPTLSFALPGSHAISPCLRDARRVPAMMHVHAEAPTAHLHADADRHVHDHALSHSHAIPSDVAASIPATAAPEQTP